MVGWLTAPLTPIRRTRRRRRRRRSLVALLAAVVAIVAVAALVVWATGGSGGGNGGTSTTVASTTAGTARSSGKATGTRRVRLVERRTGTLASPVQDAAAASVPGGVMLLGGLTAADTSRTDVRIATPTGDRAAGELPTALHDTAAVRLGSSVYLFGGGTGSNTQSDEILRVPAAGGPGVVVARLPAPSSDQSAAAIGGTAYVVGGYTGSVWLDTIVAWRPGRAARVVAHLPFAVRYAAVAPADGRLVIAGGSLENGSASAAVLAFRPGSSKVVRIGRLPAPTTHAAAATIDGVAYVIGGRGAILDTPVTRIVAVDPRTRQVTVAGRLLSPRSDLAASTLGHGILLAGGRGTAGTEALIGELRPHVVVSRPAPARRAAPPTPRGNVYAYDSANRLTGAARFARQLVYVPNSQSDTVDVIDPHTFRIVEHFAVGGAAPARRAGLGPPPALRHERHRQQPDADRPAHRQARRRRSPSTTPTTCTSPQTDATRSSSPSACTGSTSETRTHSGSTTRSPCPAPESTTWTSPPTGATCSRAASSRDR